MKSRFERSVRLDLRVLVYELGLNDFGPKEMTMARRDTNGNANGSGGAGSRSASNSAFARTSFLDGGNAVYVEQLQDSYLRDPASLDLSWREFFTQMNDARETIAKT